jgi:hypothetical protein
MRDHTHGFGKPDRLGGLKRRDVAEKSWVPRFRGWIDGGEMLL